MNITKVHIENFGKLKNFEIVFDKTLNCINEQNGWGKTTLANFIKAMFYGLPATTKKDLQKNERKKYKPWNNENFGGYLEFESENKLFRVTRFFGTKESEDEFEFVELSTSKKMMVQGNLGEQIFGIDRDAFERCVYVPQKDIDGFVNESLKEKLTNIIHGTNNKENLEKALELLDEKRAQLKRKNGLGKINECNLQIEVLSQEINNLKNSVNEKPYLQEQLLQEQQTIQNLNKENQIFDNQMQEYGKVQQIIAKAEIFEQKKSKAHQLKTELLQMENTLGQNNLLTADLEDMSKALHLANQQESKYKLLSENTTDQQKLNNIEQQFKNNVPTKEQVVEIINLSKSGVAKTPKLANKNFNFLTAIYSLLVLVGLILGFVMLNTFLLVSVISFVVAGLAILGLGFNYLKNYIDKKTSLSDYKNNSEVSSEVAKTFVKNYLNKTENTEKDLTEILMLATEYETIKKQLDETDYQKQILKTELNKTNENIFSYFAKFNFSDNLTTSEKFDRLCYINNTYQDKKTEYQVLIAELEKANLTENNKDLQNFDIAEIQKQKNITEQQIREHVVKCHNISEKIAKLDDLKVLIKEKEDMLQDLLKTQKSLEEKLNIVQNTQKFLTLANGNLSSKYLAPINNNLRHFMNILTGEDFDNLKLDIDLNTTIEQFGKAREIDYLSKGYKTLVEIALRFAILKTIFNSEKPFIILDDPFVNFDKEKIENALLFLQKLSKEYQVIYLTCHDSRC